MIPSSLHWSLVGAGELIFREWAEEDQVVVYDTAAGSTHLIEVLGMEVLKLLEIATCSVPHISESLADAFAEQDAAAVVEYITATLHQLQDAGLVVSKSL